MRDFKDQYPDGLKQTIVLFQKALYGIMFSDEIDKIIKSAHGREKLWLKRFKKEFREVVHSWRDVHWIPFVSVIDSPMLFKEIIAYMVSEDDLPTYTE